MQRPTPPLTPPLFLEGKRGGESDVKTIFQCPVCRLPLKKMDKIFSCANLHAYDIAREGYVNLLLANQKKSKAPGDSKAMVAARHRFLNQGYFSGLSKEINRLAGDIVREQPGKTMNILDAGCGEGYYLDTLSKNMGKNPNPALYGIDISREGVRAASKRNPAIHFAVAGIFDMPVADKSVNLLISIFAPFEEKEFVRVLAPDSALLQVTPGARHLWELKKSLYETPYENPENASGLAGFKSGGRSMIKYDIHLSSPEDIRCLLAMTPYYWKTDPAKIRDLPKRLSALTTGLEFIVEVFRKI